MGLYLAVEQGGLCPQKLGRPVQQDTLSLYKPGLAGGVADMLQGRGAPQQGLFYKCF